MNLLVLVKLEPRLVAYEIRPCWSLPVLFRYYQLHQAVEEILEKTGKDRRHCQGPETEAFHPVFLKLL